MEPSTPYERLIEQQSRLASESPVGYAVALATSQAQRVAYLTGTGDVYLTNDERKALIASKEEVVKHMNDLLESADWYKSLCYRIAFLVPVFDRNEYVYNGLPTYQGY